MWMMVCLFVFFFKQRTAYEMRISDWSSDVCSSDLSEPDEADSGRAQRPDFYGLPARKTRRNDKWTLVAKPRKAIHIYETGHGFRLNDRKLFNCLRYYAEVSMAWEKGASAGPPVFRSEERRVGQGCVRTCRFRWGRDTKKK